MEIVSLVVGWIGAAAAGLGIILGVRAERRAIVAEERAARAEERAARAEERSIRADERAEAAHEIATEAHSWAADERCHNRVRWEVRAELHGAGMIEIRVVNVGWGEADGPRIDGENLLGLPIATPAAGLTALRREPGESLWMLIEDHPNQIIPDTLLVTWGTGDSQRVPTDVWRALHAAVSGS